MNVKMLWWSQPDPKNDQLKFDDIGQELQEMIAYVARVSNPGSQAQMKSSEKLLQYLIDHEHWSPFEMVHVTMEIETTRDIARQILRHRSFTFQEFSQRYGDPTTDLGFVTRDARKQDPKNRQNSIDVVPGNGESEAGLINDWELSQNAVISTAEGAYGWAVKNGIAKEQARVVLPEGNTVSRMYMAGSLRSWIHYVILRSANGTQKEHMEVAQAAGEKLLTIFPMLDRLLNGDPENYEVSIKGPDTNVSLKIPREMVEALHSDKAQEGFEAMILYMTKQLENKGQ